MEPVRIDDHVITKPHRRFIIGKEQPQYLPLPAIRLEGKECEMLTRWTFTPEERMAIAAGEDLYISVYTFGQTFHPILPTVGVHEALTAIPKVAMTSAVQPAKTVDATSEDVTEQLGER